MPIRIALIVVLLSLSGYSSRSSATPIAVEVTKPLEIAFWRIRSGMTDEELFALMEPFEQRFTEHYQWQSWTDGKLIVDVTLSLNWNSLEPSRVARASLFRKTATGHRQALVVGAPLTFTLKKSLNDWDGRLGSKK